MKKKAAGGRGRFIVLGIIAVVVLSALFFLTQHFFYAKTDTAKERRDDSISPAQSFVGRKNIYDRNFRRLAVSFRLTSVYVRPLELKAPQEVARQLAEILDLDENVLLDTIKMERSFVWIGRHIAPKKAEEIAALNLKGVHMIHEVQRLYPHHTLAAHVVGFMKDEQGLAGIESYYDNVLRGAGFKDSEEVVQLVPSDASALKGANLVLTIDLDVQERLEKQLAALAKKSGAQTAMAAVMRVDDGAILGLANFPTYDLNLFWDYSAENRKNRVVSEQVLPGGIDRLFQLAAALDQGQSLGAITISAVTAEGRKDEPASEPVPDWIEISEGSYVSRELQLLGNAAKSQVAWMAFAEKIGLVGKTGIDLPEEGMAALMSEAADTAALANQYTISPAAPTALSLLTAFTRLINGGKEVKPHLLRALWENGKQWKIAYDKRGSTPAVREEISHALLSVLRNTGSSKGSEPLYFESAVVANAGFPLADEALAASDDEARVQKDAQAVLLGMAPQRAPEIALIVVVDGARLNMAEQSPLRAMANNLTGRVLKIARSKAIKNAGPRAPEEDEYYKKWLALQPRADERSAFRQDLQNEKMPDVRGYSVRKALQTLQDYGLKITIKGTGKVVAQHPSPGASLRGIEGCRLELRSMEG